MKLNQLSEQTIKFDIVNYSKNEIQLKLNDEVLYYATSEKIHVGVMGGGSKVRWFITNVQKKKSVGNTSTGYTKIEAIAKMKKFAKKNNLNET